MITVLGLVVHEYDQSTIIHPLRSCGLSQCGTVVFGIAEVVCSVRAILIFWSSFALAIQELRAQQHNTELWVMLTKFVV